MSAVITRYGVQADSQAETISKLTNEMRNIYGQDIELSPNTPDGQLIGILAQMNSDQTEAIKNLFASLFPSTANGVFLDYNLDIIGMDRRSGSYAKANLRMDFEGTQSISAGAFIAEIQGVKFANDAAIAEAGIYTFTAMEAGSMQFADDEPVSIVTSVSGLSVSFAGTISGGSDYETDYDFRSRWSDLISTRKNSATYIEKQIRQIEGVTDCNVYETAEESFNGIPPNSIYAILSKGYFSNKTVLDSIYDYKPPGIRSYFENDSPDQQAMYGKGSNIAIGFDLATMQNIPNYSFNFYSKSSNARIDSDTIALILKSMKFKINESVFVSSVNNFVISKIPDCYADIGNNINGYAFLNGNIRVAYEF